MTHLNRRPARPFCSRRRPTYPRLLGISLVVAVAASCAASSAEPDYPPPPGGIGPEFEEPMLDPGEEGEGGRDAAAVVATSPFATPPPPGPPPLPPPVEPTEEYPPAPGGDPGSFQ